MRVRPLVACAAVLLAWSAITATAQELPSSQLPAPDGSDAGALEPAPAEAPGAAVAPVESDAWAAGGFEAPPDNLSGPAADSGDAEATSQLTSHGEVALEARGFLDDGNAASRDRELGLASRLELDHTHGAFEERARLLGRFDILNHQRRLLLLEELWVQARLGALRLRLGAELINWSATEAFHPADVINARNFDSDLQNFEKRGEPMLDLQLGPLSGTTLKVLLMPYRTQPLFAPLNSRMSFAPGIAFGDDLRVDREGRLSRAELGPQAAVELQQVVGSADISLHALEHMDRSQPVIGVNLRDGRVTRLYQTVRQVGLTYQQVLGPLILKVEGVYRWFVPADDISGVFAPLLAPGVPALVSRLPRRDHGAGAIGLEYGFVHGGGAQSTIVVEGTAIVGADKATRDQLSVFQRDVLVGYRLDLNDEQARVFFVGVIVDLERRAETLTTVEWSQRVGDALTARLRLRIFTAERDSPGLGVLRPADSLQLLVTRHF